MYTNRCEGESGGSREGEKWNGSDTDATSRTHLQLREEGLEDREASLDLFLGVRRAAETPDARLALDLLVRPREFALFRL